MERFKVNPLTMPNSGRCVIEDFVPYSETRALVTAGPNYRELIYIADVQYEFRQELHLSDSVVLLRGKYLRLGHFAGDELVCSDGWEGPHQPFRHASGYYYTDDAPNARLYRDGRVLIDHWPGVCELGNAWVDDFIWFEARHEDMPAPAGWNLYRADLDGLNISHLFVGANPCMYGDSLYYGLWNGETFDVARTDRRDCLPADAHLPTGRADPNWRLVETA